MIRRPIRLVILIFVLTLLAARMPFGSEQTSEQVAAKTLPPLASSLRPVIRPDGLVEKAMARRPTTKPAAAICGLPDVVGTVVGAVPGKIKGCGIEEAVKITSVAGIGLTQASVLECSTVEALHTWVTESVEPVLEKRGGGLSKLQVAAHYVCRTRNHKPGAKISEHGKGRAIDISGFVLKDQSVITITQWRDRNASKVLRQLHKDACGPFGTVLGPESDKYHQNHFHLDTAQYRAGPYCR